MLQQFSNQHLLQCSLAYMLPAAEAIVRGHKSGLLTVPDYNNLTQCEALDDIKLNLVRHATNMWLALAAIQPAATEATTSFISSRSTAGVTAHRQGTVLWASHASSLTLDSCSGQQQ